jgi:hypothetical protein
MNRGLKALLHCAPWALLCGVGGEVAHTQAPPTSVASPPAPPVPAADVRPALPGFWEHERCQVQGGEGRQTGSRSLFAFVDREWAIAFTQYADGACQVRVLTATLRGTYEATGPSRRVPGAVEATFRFARKALAVYDPLLLDRLNAGACGRRRWSLGVEQDITAAGCLAIESVAACTQEYDLVHVDGDRLYFGERPPPGTNICAEGRRPTRLRTEPLRRR